MPTDRRRASAHDERHIEVTGSSVDGGIGGIRVGRDLKVTSTVSSAPEDALTDPERQLVQAVLDAALRTGSPMSTSLAAALDQLGHEVAEQPAQRSRVRSVLEQVAYHAGTAGAVLAAAQLALEAMT
jgi:hypothetical protein